jgi:prefoldin subunit 4
LAGSRAGLYFSFFFTLSVFTPLLISNVFYILSSLPFSQKSLERLDDASTELMMASGDKVMLLIGESFFDTTEEKATEYCEAEVERMSELLETFEEEESEILGKQAELKKTLYGRFGKSIQLEETV